MRTVTVLLCFAGIGFAQQQPAIDPLVYGGFLRAVDGENSFLSFLATSPEMAQLVAKVQAAHPGVQAPSIRRDAFFTDAEWEAVSKIATDFSTKLGGLMREVPRWALVLQETEGAVSPALEKRVLELEQRRADLIASHVHRLHDALGDERFEALNVYIQRPEKRGWRPLPRLVE